MIGQTKKIGIGLALGILTQICFYAIANFGMYIIGVRSSDYPDMVPLLLLFLGAILIFLGVWYFKHQKKSLALGILMSPLLSWLLILLILSAACYNEGGACI